MRVCGVEIKSNETLLCLLSVSDGLFNIADCRVNRLVLQEINSQEQLKQFQTTFQKLMEDYQVGKVVIRERMKKGKFAGGAVGFKLEAAIQLADDLDVELLAPTEIKKIINDHPLPIRFADTDLKAFQEEAFKAAYAYLMAKDS